MRDLGAVLLILGVLAALGAVFHYATRTKGQHAAPYGDTPADVLPEQAADRFTPGVVVPFTPQLGEPLKPLPTPNAPGPDGVGTGGKRAADPVTAGPGARHLVAVPAPKERLPEIDMLVAEVKEWFGLDKSQQRPRPAHARDGQTTGEIFEHLCEGEGCWCKPWTPAPAGPPAEVVEGLGHHTVDAAVESIVHRALTADLLARMDAEKEASDA